MSWIKIGRDREALHYKGEIYKKTVIRYFETKEYSLYSTSSLEGGLSDVIMTKQGSPTIHIEVKDTEISIFQQKIKNMILKYFCLWNAKKENDKFTFIFFAKKFNRDDESKKVIGSDAELESVEKWLKGKDEEEEKPLKKKKTKKPTKAEKFSKKEKKILAESSIEDRFEFLRSSYVYESSGYDLSEHIEEYFKKLSKLPESRIIRLYDEVIKRKDPVKKPSTILFNS